MKQMDGSLPRVADLRAIAEALDRTEPESTLSNAVKNASRAQSCVADISVAISGLEALAQLRGAPRLPDLHHVAVEAAILGNAVLLYARATSTGAKEGERGHISIRSRLSVEHQQLHDRIIDIRNGALAHVKSNEVVAEQLWHRDIVVAVEQSNGVWLPAAMTKRVQVNEVLLGGMRNLYPQSFKLLRETFLKRLTHVTNVLNERPDSDDLLTNHQLDPVEFFGSVDEARKALRRKPGQRVMGTILR